MPSSARNAQSSLVAYYDSSEVDSDNDGYSDDSIEHGNFSDDGEKPNYNSIMVRDESDLVDREELEIDEKILALSGWRRQQNHDQIQSDIYNTARDTFRKLVCNTESKVDLKLLYPPSIWEEDGIYDDNDHTEALRDAFLSLSSGDHWKEFDLINFCIYHSLEDKKYPGQYENLHVVSSEKDKKQYLLDGVVEHNGKTLVIQGARVTDVSIGGLEMCFHSCGDQFWVQITGLSSVNGWLRLRSPSPGYQTSWLEFCWVANFAKYCMDYLWLTQEKNEVVTLDGFRSRFLHALTEMHQQSSEFLRWKKKILNHDMRRHIAQFGPFVYDLCHQRSLAEHFDLHPLWQDIGSFSWRNPDGGQKTVVTKNVADTFLPSYPQWGAKQFDLLQQTNCDEQVNTYRHKRMKSLGLFSKFEVQQTGSFSTTDEFEISQVEWTLQRACERNRPITCQPKQLLNKLVVVRNSIGNKVYFDFALVTQIAKNNQHVRIAWLTIPSQTICASPRPGIDTVYDERQKLKARYPVGNELFFSDDCNCFAVRIADIVSVHDISTFNDCDDMTYQFFAVMQYREIEKCFTRTTRDQLLHTCKNHCRMTSAERLQSMHATRRRQHNSNPPDHNEEPNNYVSNNCLQDSKLSNLSLFSGCGLLDRALESSGKLQTVLSIDSNPFAMCSARANQEPCSDTVGEFVVGSVNDELLKVADGRRKCPAIGCLSAGCPCPGFSIFNPNKESKESQRDCTLLASTMSWIEVVLPGYVVIENVPNMDFGSPSACSQAISFLVALGYQVRKVHLKSTDYGGCTIRERLFILAAAPIYQLPKQPTPTHGSAVNLKPYLTAKAATSDLDRIHNDTTLNTQYPYHIPLDRLVSNIITQGPNLRDIMRRIPTTPPSQGLATSLHFLTKDQERWALSLDYRKLVPRSQTMRRVDPDGFFRTVVTTASWRCCNTGQLVHYDQHRLLSLEEVARAQGFPKDFVLIGNSSQKLRQVGNAVPWCLREAIGREVAKSYQQSQRANSNPLEAVKDEKSVSDRIETVSRDMSDDEDIVFITKEEFELAQTQHTVGCATYKPGTDNSSDAKTCFTSDRSFGSRRPDTATKHAPKAEVMEKDTFKRTSLRTTPHGTIELNTETRKLVRIRKRSRSQSVTLTDGDRDNGLFQRQGKKRAER